MPDTAPPAAPVEMPPKLVQFLLGGQTCIVATVDEQGRPLTSLMTWVVARDAQTLTVAIDTRGRALRNVQATSHVAVEVLGNDICYGLRGTAVVEKQPMTSTPFPCALVAIHVDEVRDHGAAGVRFMGPSYTFDAGKEHRLEVEKVVFNELRGVAPTV